MDEAALRQLLDDVRAGRTGPDDAVAELRRLPFRDLGYARVDHHRALRTGRPEAVYAPGKTPEQCAGIVAELLDAGATVVLSRADPLQLQAVAEVAPGGTVTSGPGGVTAVWNAAPTRPESVVVATAGTADLPVAGECAAVLAAYGFQARVLADIGVAGLQRLLAEVPVLQEADAIVVVAGMEGALASVIGGLSAAPVVAVPTSAGYGSSLEGVTALLGMLASCASGLVVVGVDNGFGAAHAVARFLPSGAVRSVSGEIPLPLQGKGDDG